MDVVRMRIRSQSTETSEIQFALATPNMKTRNEPINQRDTEELFPLLDQLIDGWCERRALRELRLILAGYPMPNMLTDGW